MSQKRFALRPLRLTRQATNDEVERRSVQRGFVATMETARKKESVADACDTGRGECVDDTVLDEPMPVDEPTLYELESKSSVTAWNTVRSSVLDVVTESCAMTIEQKCFRCKGEAILRCLQCGPLGFFCESCFSELHQVLNIFHLPERWQVSFVKSSCLIICDTCVSE